MTVIMPCMNDGVKPLTVWLLLIAIIILPVQAKAFGTNAHLIVGYIADEQICASTREAIAPFLVDGSLAETGLWADKIRGYKQWDYAKPWHYMNVPDGMAIRQAARYPGGDVLLAIEDMQERLANPSLTSERHRDAFRFLVHFIADIHQPLHVGRREDLGGNKIKIRYVPAPGKRPKSSNLHKYWDSVALNSAVENPKAYAAALMGRMAPEMRNWQPNTPLDWATESQDWRSEVYAFPAAAGGEAAMLDEAYRLQALQILDQRLTLAGLRLAATLDELYCQDIAVQNAETKVK
jgi:hypothetical protein